VAPATQDLFRLLSASPGERVDVREPGLLVERALMHGLSAVVLSAVKEHAAAPLPDELQRKLTMDARAIAGQSLKLRMLLSRTLRALAAQGVNPVVLKGYALGARIYPDALMRPSTDVDVFVREDELSAAARAMAMLELRAQDEHSRDYFREHHHHLTYSGQAGMVEVHFRLITGFGASIDWSDLRAPFDDQLEDVAFKRLSPEDDLCYLAIHAAQHVFSRLSWLYDLKRFVIVERELDWSRVTDLATKSGFAVPLWSALTAVRHCFRADIPVGVIEELRPSPARAAALDALLSADHLHDGYFHDRRNLYFAQLLMTATANRAVRFAGHHAARAAKRKFAARFPRVAPGGWRG
jgi:hypothetical protein